MRVNPNPPDKQQLIAFQNRRAETIFEEVKKAYDQFSHLNNLERDTKLGTVHVSFGYKTTLDGGFASDRIINVDLQTYKGYFVAHNSSMTLFTGKAYETHPINDDIYEIISPASSRYQRLSGEAKERIIKAIIDSVEVSSTPTPDGMEQILDELIFPILFDARVDIRTSIDDLPFGCKLVSKHAISTVVRHLLEGEPLQPSLASKLNSRYSALIGPKHLTFFKSIKAA